MRSAIIIISIALICFALSGARGEAIYGKGRISSDTAWDISLGGPGVESDFYLSTIDVPHIYSTNGARMLSLLDTPFLSVSYAPGDSTAYDDAGLFTLYDTATYIVQTTEGNFAKVHITFYGQLDDQNNNIEWVYQNDGTYMIDHLLSTDESSWGVIKQLYLINDTR